MDRINITINRIALKWAVPSGILHDVYSLMTNDPRFFSTRKPFGIKYQAMADHLKLHYHITVSERQLRYLVQSVHDVKHGDKHSG